MRLIIPAAIALFAHGAVYAVNVRKSPAEYSAQGKGSDFEIGADYMVRSFLAEKHTFTIDNYLLVEVGVFPRGDTKISLDRFALRVNGKNVLLPQTPGIVAASVKYPDWNRRPAVQAQAGPLIFGRRQPAARFPGDTRDVPRNPTPAPVATQESEPVDYTSVISDAALPEGGTKRPVAGYIFFAFDGKLKSIKSVELLVDGTPLALR